MGLSSMGLFRNTDETGATRSFLSRTINLTSPNLPGTMGEYRSQSRYNRTIVVGLFPWGKKGPAKGEPTVAITKDVSETGLALVTQHLVECSEWLIGFPPTEREGVGTERPFFTVGNVLQATSLGGGYWQVGVDLRDVPAKHHHHIESLAPRLMGLCR